MRNDQLSKNKSHLADAYLFNLIANILGLLLSFNFHFSYNTGNMYGVCCLPMGMFSRKEATVYLSYIHSLPYTWVHS